MKCYQATNIAEAYLTQQHLQASKILQQQNCDGAFDHFFNESVMFVSGKGYLIIDVNLFRQVIRTFFYCAQNEYEKILLKIESDQKYKINFTEKALQEFDEMQRLQCLKERESNLNRNIDSEFDDTSSSQMKDITD